MLQLEIKLRNPIAEIRGYLGNLGEEVPKN